MIKYDIWLLNYCVLLGSSPLTPRMGNASTHNTYFMIVLIFFFFFFFHSERTVSPSCCPVSESSCSLRHVSILFFFYSGRAGLVPVFSQGQKWKPLYTDYRGRCIEEMIWVKKNQVLLMEHSETKPFVNSLAPEKSFCLEIFIFYCLEACAGLSDDIFFFFT